jgi:hypothetical protein
LPAASNAGREANREYVLSSAYPSALRSERRKDGENRALARCALYHTLAPHKALSSRRSAIKKPSNNMLLAAAYLDCETWVRSEKLKPEGAKTRGVMIEGRREHEDGESENQPLTDIPAALRFLLFRPP